MKNGAHHAAIAAAAVLSLAACGGPQRESIDLPDSPGGRMLRQDRNPNAAYAEGIDLRNRGNCPGAIEKLRPVANMGPGYANAQTALGVCLLTVGNKGGALTKDFDDGLTWLQRAADSGWPEAQGALARVHLIGPESIRNGEEAAYWLTLYEVNAGRIRIGFVAISGAEVKAMENALSPADKAAGVKRARQWRRQIWLPPPQETGKGPEAGGEGKGPPRSGMRRPKREGA